MHSLEELLAAAALAPDDDAPRLVLQDALLERKDPRGELLALQFKQLRLEDSAEDRARVRKLLGAHAAEWMGALATFIDAETARFDRGYLARVRLRPEAFTDAARATWLKEPTLPLLRELSVPAGVAATELEATLRSPALARLGVVTCEELRVADRLSRSAIPWTFRGAGLVGTVKQVMDVADRAMAAPAFGALERLVIEGQRFSRGAALDLSKRLAKAAWAPRLRALAVRAEVDGDVLGYASSVLAPVVPNASLTLESGGLLLRLRRDAGHVALELVGEHGPEPLFKTIGAMSGAVRTLRVQQHNRAEPGDVELDALRAHLRRLKPARVSLPVGWGIPDEGF